MAVINNLYPPVMDTYMPAFLIQPVTTGNTTVTYTQVSYAALDAYNTAVNNYIINSSISGVQELYDEYQAALADLRAQYDDPSDPELIERERVLFVTYKAYLEALLAGSSTQNVTENVFFEEKPETTSKTITTTYKTVNPRTTERNFICRVYFSLSEFNSISEIANAQVTVRSQLTNKSVLHKIKYPCEVMLKLIQLDPEREQAGTKDKYFIEIKPEDLNGNNFTIDQYYKVQIRFTSATLPDGEDPNAGIDLHNGDAIQSISHWLSVNLRYFSEWSIVCLVRGISVPTLTLKDFSEAVATDIWDTIINTQVLGNLTFANRNETETLRNYRIKAYDSNNNLLLDSGDIYTSNFSDVNSIDYTMNYWFQADHEYYFTLTYVTQNLYTETHKYEFTVSSAEVPDLNLQITAYKDEENGRIGMHINRSRSYGKYTGRIIIRRACAQDNFARWEDMYIATFDHEPYIDVTWYDYTIESGVFYLYGIQAVNTQGARAPMKMFREPIMINFDHMFLTCKDKQLKIKFNPSISSFKRNISETKIDTIGSKYPFVKRNGDVNYIQFPIGGLIAAEMDEEGLFTTKEEIYKVYQPNYAEYNWDNYVVDYQDMVWEKFFREAVEKFLESNDVKLFRSPTEGNILIKLMDVNYQPNQTLGRRLWSFTATAYEIDECTLDNYEKYGIFTRRYGDKVLEDDGDKTLIPIRRVVFVDEPEDFPEPGQEKVLYIYNNEIYVWVESTQKYKIISVPLWDEEFIDLDGLTGVVNRLYTDNQDLYVWNKVTGEYDKLSFPIMEG